MVFETSLEIDECRRRLTESLDSECISLFSLSGYAGGRPFFGTVKPYQFRFKKRKFYKNGYDPYFFGTLQAHATGTRIEGKFGMSPYVRAFMTLWFTFAIVIGGILLVNSLLFIFTSHSKTSGSLWLGVLVPILLPTLAFGMIKFGQRASRGDMQEMTEFLTRTLEIKGER